jgi:hypothetical protein
MTPWRSGSLLTRSGLLDGSPITRASHEFIGGAERDRTADLLVANEALSQLSYSPTPKSLFDASLAATKRDILSSLASPQV